MAKYAKASYVLFLTVISQKNASFNGQPQITTDERCSPTGSRVGLFSNLNLPLIAKDDHRLANQQTSTNSKHSRKTTRAIINHFTVKKPFFSLKQSFLRVWRPFLTIRQPFQGVREGFIRQNKVSFGIGDLY
jgi:hypothetical protein